MDELKTEEEQIEQFKAWWSEYGAYVIGGVVLGALVLFGWNYQGSSRLEAQREASALYDELTDDVVDGDLDAAEGIAARIEEEYPNTAYVAQSKLAMARLYMDENRDEDAANTLRELIGLDGIDEIRLIAKLRLSKVLLYQGKAQEALDTVADPSSEAFAARFAEARGDAHVALGDFEAARAAYTEALNAPNAQRTIDQGFVRLKLFDLPEVMVESAVEEATVEESAVEEATVEEATDEESAEQAAPDGEPADEEAAQ